MAAHADLARGGPCVPRAGDASDDGRAGALGIDSWEFWRQTQYKMKFAELAKLCRPETLEAAKAAAKKK